MLSEIVVTSIRAQQKSANTAIPKDVGIYVHSLNPTFMVRSTFKNSSTHINCLAVSSTHIFAAQADKAVLHVYSRDRGNQEALISFPERIHSIALVNDGLLALGTVEGRILLWEVCTGRQVSTPASHLQLVSCLASTKQILISGSDDSNIHIWSMPTLMSLTSIGPHEPLRSLSNHRAAITALAMGHSSDCTNICISASKDNTCVVWDYSTGALLRTFLLPATPLCLSLDPCDRAFYVGSEDGSIRTIDLFEPMSTINSLYDSKLQTTPIQVISEPLSGAPSDIGSASCLGVSYDGTSLLSGHGSGKIIQWDVGPKKFSKELVDVNAPINNMQILSPFPESLAAKAVMVVKPRLGESDYAYTGQLIKTLHGGKYDEVFHGPGFPSDMLAEAITRFYAPAQTGSAGDAELRKENEELWAIVKEQRALQKRTYEKYREANT
ncbi:MAG: Pre-rRNA-processing protein ipi3 [Claussenomyces sp. TS43310]|nr:MAG: Pre-rRNA-processing protein ipi3 [Claussenomyces sp. TS43310]